MNRKLIFILVVLILSLILAGAARAVGVSLPAADLEDDYAITWWTVDGGGGTSQGGTFQVTGTIGQPDTSRAAGGLFVVEGGFWTWDPLYKVFTPVIQR